VNQKLIELALKKQRLQLKSAALRDDWVSCASALKPLCTGADRVRDAAVWLRRHPELLVAGAVALLVARPRAVFRWARRSISVVRLWRRLRGWLSVGLLSG
jgi:hypothetical protein